MDVILVNDLGLGTVVGAVECVFLGYNDVLDAAWSGYGVGLFVPWLTTAQLKLRRERLRGLSKTTC